MYFDLEIYKKIGSRIKEARKLRGWSQPVLAEYLRISYQQLQKYEKGKNRISCGILCAIAECFKTDISYFLDGFIPLHEKGNSIVNIEDVKILKILKKIEHQPKRKEKIAKLLNAAIDYADDTEESA